MSNNKTKYLLLAVVALITLACNQPKDSSILWGETKSYNKFLWVEQTPDTLKQTLCFDFNSDARDFMHEQLLLGIFKKNADNQFVQLTEDEIEIFANGAKMEGNIISVPSSCTEMEVGIVFNPKAEDKTHYWYVRPIDNAGLDRINDRATDNAATEDAIMEIKLRKEHVMNPLGLGLLIFLFALIIIILIWFCIIKPIVYPHFSVNKLQLVGPEPYLNTIKLKQYRKVVLTSKATTQNVFNRMLTGEIKYSVNPMWTADVEYEPKDKKSVRIRYSKDDYLSDTRILKIDEEYTLENLKTKSKTTMRIS